MLRVQPDKDYYLIVSLFLFLSGDFRLSSGQLMLRYHMCFTNAATDTQKSYFVRWFVSETVLIMFLLYTTSYSPSDSWSLFHQLLLSSFEFLYIRRCIPKCNLLSSHNVPICTFSRLTSWHWTVN